VRDGWARRAVKAVARAWSGADLWVTRLLLRARGEPRYRLAGTCNGCGRCCESPAIRAGWLAWRLPRWRALVLWWHRVVNGFELTETDARFRLFVFRCTHYDAATRQCDSYSSRPLLCRDYPKNLLYEALPQLFPECSHGVVAKNAEKLKAALERTQLSAEARQELEKKLYLREDSGRGDD
jgi:Fe-S-cluster containining protein